MTITTVLVADDEPLARRRLIRMLRRMEGVSVIGEAEDVARAVAQVARLQPDLLLLDVQMPGGDGFTVLEKLKTPAPQTIFVTAFDHHALRAFEVAAVDYVTKPVDPARLSKAIERAMAARASTMKVEALTTAVSQLRTTLAEVSIPRPALWIKQRNGLLRVEVDDIIYARAERDYVQLHLTEKTCLYPENMAALEVILAPFGFARIHRSSLVRLKAIRKVQRGVDGRYLLHINDGTSLVVGRTYSDGLRKIISLYRTSGHSG